MIGRQISRYRIIERLGAGGMGVVYKAQDTELGRFVALKFLPSTVAADTQVLERFLREARAAAALNHPHICTIYEVNGNPSEPFIVMEYLEGRTLRERIAGQPLAQDFPLDLAIQLSDALAAAHERHIVHRDIKPANIFITKSDQVKILDFGLAKLVQTGGSDDLTTFDGGDQATGAGTTVGTVSYMSPEQARGEDVDHRSDIFSLGSVLYEMATGRLAFEGNTPAVIYNGILSLAPKPIDQLNPNVAPDLVRIINRCLEKNRELRYQSVTDLRSDLKRLKRDTESHVSLPSAAAAGVGGTRGNYKALAVVAAVIAVVVVAGALMFPRLRTSGEVMKETDVILLTDFTNTTGDAMFDGTLKQALALKLEESTFLNVFPEQQIRETLTFMRRSPDEKVSPEIGREICQRQNLKAMMNGDIAQLGSQYVITLLATECGTGNVLARDQVQASTKEEVLKSVGQAAINMRQKLGESLPMIQKMNAPIEQATTSSLDALKAFAAAESLRTRGAEGESIPLYERAIEIDPEFGVAHTRLGVILNNQGRKEEAKKLITRGYELRDRVSERERLYATAHYQRVVEGDADKAISTYKLWRQTYPRDYIPATNLGNIYLGTGRLKEAAEQLQDSITLFTSPIGYGNLAGTYAALGEREKMVATYKSWLEKLPSDGSPHVGLSEYYKSIGEHEQALAESQRALELEPIAFHYFMLMRAYTNLNKLEDAKATAEKAIAEKRDNPDLHYMLAMILWRRGDQAALRREEEWWKGKEYEPFLPAFQAIFAAAEGRLRDAESLCRRSVEMGSKNGTEEGFPRFATTPAVVYSGYGDHAKAVEMIRAALKKQRNRYSLVDGAIVMAAAGNEEEVNPILVELAAKFPNDVFLNKLTIPSIKAMLALHKNQPEDALNQLKDTAPYADMMVDYVRGLANAKAGRHRDAIAVFQKIVDQYGIGLVSNPVAFQQAHLQLARSYMATGDAAKARQYYDTFFAFFKNPDPDIPLLRDARAEYAKIRSS
jgi:tetratricopeptide (TPR) repeat protein